MAQGAGTGSCAGKGGASRICARPASRQDAITHVLHIDSRIHIEGPVTRVLSARVATVWRAGASGRTGTLTADALAGSTDLSQFSGRVSDSGEGRWTVLAAVDVGAPATVLGAALFERFAWRGEADFGDCLLSAMRKQFGGHASSRPPPARKPSHGGPKPADA